MQQQSTEHTIFVDTNSRAYLKRALERAPYSRDRDALLQKINRTGARSNITFSASDSLYIGTTLLDHAKSNNPFDPGLQSKNGMRILESLAKSLSGTEG